MSKPVGEVTLDSGHDLYGLLLAIIPFTEQPEGPARIIVTGAPDVDTPMTYADLDEPDAEDEAWNSDPPSLLMDSTTSKREYTHNAAILSSFPFSLGIMFKTAASGGIAYPCSFCNSGDAPNDNMLFQYGTGAGQKPKFQIERNAVQAQYLNSNANLTSSTHYVFVVNVSDSSYFTVSSNSLEGKQFLIDSTSGNVRLYTFRASPSQVDDIDIGTDIAGSVDNAVACINDAGGGGYWETGSSPHNAVHAVKEGTDKIRIWRIPGVVSTTPDTPVGRPNWPINLGGDAGYTDKGPDMDPTASPDPTGEAYVSVYKNNGSEEGGAGALAVGFPNDINTVRIGGGSEQSFMWGNGNFDMLAIFDRGLDATNRTKFYNMRPGGSDEYGVLVAPTVYKTFTAQSDITLDATAATVSKVFAEADVPQVLHPSLGMPPIGRGPGRGM